MTEITIIDDGIAPFYEQGPYNLVGLYLEDEALKADSIWTARELAVFAELTTEELNREKRNDEIFQMHKRKVPITEIAKQFGLCRQTVQNY